jgi:hypothetical protein
VYWFGGEAANRAANDQGGNRSIGHIHEPRNNAEARLCAAGNGLP